MDNIALIVWKLVSLSEAGSLTRNDATVLTTLKVELHNDGLDIISTE